VTYDGALKDAGSYRFSTHNGEIAVTVPERANATVSVATYNGEFSSSFPVQLKETRRGKRFNFTIGNGGARVELESFQGEIRLRRPGDAEGLKSFQYREKQKEKDAEERALKEYEKAKRKNAEEGGQEP